MSSPGLSPVGEATFPMSESETTDLKVRLIHGTSDFIPVEDAAEFAALLTDAGYDVELATFDGGHEIAPPELLFPTVMEVVGQ